MRIEGATDMLGGLLVGGCAVGGGRKDGNAWRRGRGCDAEKSGQVDGWRGGIRGCGFVGYGAVLSAIPDTVFPNAPAAPQLGVGAVDPSHWNGIMTIFYEQVHTSHLVHSERNAPHKRQSVHSVVQSPTPLPNPRIDTTIQLISPQIKRHPPQHPVPQNNHNHIPHILPHVSRPISIARQHRLPLNETLLLQPARIHAVAPALGRPLARVVAPAKLVDHHAAEHVRLVVDVVEHVPPEHVERLRLYHEPVDAHPQPVCKGRGCQRDDEERNQRREQHDEGLGRDEVEKQPENPRPERRRRVAEVAQPVRDEREEQRDEEEEGRADQEVGRHERRGAVQSVEPLFGVQLQVFEVGGDVGDGHEGHEGPAEEDGVCECVDVGLDGVEPEPHGAHHDGEAHVHRDADAVRHDIPVALDERSMHKGEGDEQRIRRVVAVVDGKDCSIGLGFLDLGLKKCHIFGLGPGFVQLTESICSFCLVVRKVRVHQLDNKFGRVDIQRRLIADTCEIIPEIADRPIVHCLATGQEQELIEKLECSG